MNITRQGIQFNVLDEPITSSWRFWDLFSNGQWEPSTFEVLDQILKPDSLFFDIGAWIGPVTLWAAKKGCKVISVEPDPEAFRQLEENVRLNDLNVTLIQKAVSNHELTERLNVSTPGDSKSSLTYKFQNSIEVQATTLDKLIEEYGKPDLIKMDIEGGESLVLPYSGPLLRRLKIPVLIGLHPFWYISRSAMENELKHWNRKDYTNELYLIT